MKRALYLTTTLPYVNADPHIGFALEMVQADVYARYRSSLGDDVFFNTGTDEHGQKIFEAAKKAGKEPHEYVDEYAAKFRLLKEKLDLSADLHFIRTTDSHHVRAAQEIWKRCAAKGDIEKRKYKGLYCVGDEAFTKESELVNGRCPNHPNMELIELEEENYFFLLGKYQKPLLEYLGKEGVIVPEWRRQEAIKFVEKGLEDFSISRVKEKMSWGIPVPGDDSQVMYVWFDALTNYISTLGWPDESEGSNFDKFWKHGEVVQMAGKDQVRFQSIMWQAMLMSASIKNTDRVIYHGFITSGGQKMSKSLGNVIDPLAIVQEYGTDAMRYFLARHVQPFEDTDVTMERFNVAYNAYLVNGLGNAVSRVMRLCEQYLNESGVVIHTDIDSATEKYIGYKVAIENYRFDDALVEVFNTISHIDFQITTQKPFMQLKSDKSEEVDSGREILLRLREWVWEVGILLQPFMPDTSEKILLAVRENKKPANLFPRKE